jgi:hypothetical protein
MEVFHQLYSLGVRPGILAKAIAIEKDTKFLASFKHHVEEVTAQDGFSHGMLCFVLLIQLDPGSHAAAFDLEILLEKLLLRVPLAVREDRFLFKISADASRLSQSSSFTSFCVIPDIGSDHFQSIFNCYVFGLARGSESSSLFSKISSLSNVLIH